MVFNGQLYTLEEDRISNNFIYRGLLQCRMTLMCKVSGCQIPTAGQKQCQLFNCHLWDLKKWDGTAYVLQTEQFRKLVHEVGLLSIYNMHYNAFSIITLCNVSIKESIDCMCDWLSHNTNNSDKASRV